MGSTFMDAPSQTQSIKDATLKNPTLWKCLKGREIAILVKNVLQVQLVRSVVAMNVYRSIAFYARRVRQPMVTLC